MTDPQQDSGTDTDTSTTVPTQGDLVEEVSIDGMCGVY